MRAATHFVHFQKETCKKQKSEREKERKEKAKRVPIIHRVAPAVWPLGRTRPDERRAVWAGPRDALCGGDFLLRFFGAFFSFFSTDKHADSPNFEPCRRQRCHLKGPCALASAHARETEAIRGPDVWPLPRRFGGGRPSHGGPSHGGPSAGGRANHCLVLASAPRHSCVLSTERNPLWKGNCALALCRVWASVTLVMGTWCLQAT